MAKKLPDNWVTVKPGLFDGFRNGFFPTIYKANPTAVTADVLEAGLIYAAVILGFSLLIILPGIRSKQRISTLIRIVITVFVLVAIMLCNFGQEWEVSHIKTKTQYRAGLSEDINADIGVLIGLRSVNITLRYTDRPDYIKQFEGGKVNETINYNERLSWDNPGWTVGRAGFGPLAGLFNREFREHQRKGSPYPILWIAEYFTLDGEGVRWGRHYLQAGFYTHIMIWSALSAWLLTMILYKMVILYGACMSIFTGTCLFAGNILFATVRNPYPLVIPFEGIDGKDGMLKFHYGWCFWLCVITGFVTVITGIVVVILDQVLPEDSGFLSDFFGIDVLQELEEFYKDPSEDDDQIEGRAGGRSGRFKKGKTILRAQPSVTFMEASSASTTATGRSDDEMDSRGAAEAEVVMDTGNVQVPAHRYQRQISAETKRGYRRRTVFPTSVKHPTQRGDRTAPLRPPRSGGHQAANV